MERLIFEVVEVEENKEEDLTEKVSLVRPNSVCCNKTES